MGGSEKSCDKKHRQNKWRTGAKNVTTVVYSLGHKYFNLSHMQNVVSFIPRHPKPQSIKDQDLVIYISSRWGFSWPIWTYELKRQAIYLPHTSSPGMDGSRPPMCRELEAQRSFHLQNSLKSLLVQAVDPSSTKLSQEICGLPLYFIPCHKNRDHSSFWHMLSPQLNYKSLGTSRFCETASLIFLGMLLSNWEDLLGTTLILWVLLIKCIKAWFALRLRLTGRLWI